MIYLDNSATTPLCAAAKDSIIQSMVRFGNPSSVHSLGVQAKRALEAARADILLTLGIRAMNTHRVIFTSCGTESDNLAIFGVLSAKSFRQKPRFITTDSEHSAILAPLEHLEKKGEIELIKLSTKGGKLDLTELDKALTPNTALVSIMCVNNETGAIYDVKTAFALAKRKVPSALTHTDFTQAYLKTEIAAVSLGADMVTVSGHKINAPKGVGALIVSERVIKEKKLVPTLLGGGQERGYRSGTENMIGICAFAAAAKAVKGSEFKAFASELRGAFTSLLDPRIVINTPEKYAPHIISITMPGVLASHAVNALSEKGICVSVGSACSSNGGHQSLALENFGIDKSAAESTVRVSIGIQNTKEEMIAAASAVNAVFGDLLSVFG